MVGGRCPSVEDNFQWMTTLKGRRPLLEDDLRWKTILACCLVRFEAFFPYNLIVTLESPHPHLVSQIVWENIFQSVRITSAPSNIILGVRGGIWGRGK